MTPSAKAAQQIQRYEFNTADGFGWADDIGHLQEQGNGSYVKYSDHLQALSDSLRPYREALEKAQCEMAYGLYEEAKKTMDKVLKEAGK